MSSSLVTPYPVSGTPPATVKRVNTEQILRIVGCLIVVAVGVWSAYIINSNPYTYQTRFWMYFLLGLLTYIVLLMIDDALKVKIVETTQYGILLIALVFNAVIVASHTSAAMSLTPTAEFVNASVFLIGLSTLHAIFVVVKATSTQNQATVTATVATRVPASASAATTTTAQQLLTSSPVASDVSTPQVIDNDKYDELFEQIYSEGYQDGAAQAAGGGGTGTGTGRPPRRTPAVDEPAP